MSIKSKVLAAAATLTLVGGIGTAGALTAGTASAATPSCGFTCINLFSYDFGTHKSPNFVVDILFRTANFDPAEDWTAGFQGTVADLYAAHMVSAQVALHYGCIPDGTNGGNFPNCPANVFGIPASPGKTNPVGALVNTFDCSPGTRVLILFCVSYQGWLNSQRRP